MDLDPLTREHLDSLGLHAEFERAWARFEQRRIELGHEPVFSDQFWVANLAGAWRAHKRDPSPDTLARLREFARQCRIIPARRVHLAALTDEGVDAELQRLFAPEGASR